eukprot:CAMPEP_0180712458 /NCGR_PEP_ID=MMETSP1038_2-20121128/11387_1 /TAXON_ID=632150 /ORGANISM="Azadinium spinosum, Strain 3D9" /LENGTH=49 /DNA_ID=CAMNT_0022744733 /DNA_START=608 /DNA_END=757 /DNA_ORIENTATION=-
MKLLLLSSTTLASTPSFVILRVQGDGANVAWRAALASSEALATKGVTSS